MSSSAEDTAHLDLLSSEEASLISEEPLPEIETPLPPSQEIGQASSNGKTGSPQSIASSSKAAASSKTSATTSKAAVSTPAVSSAPASSPRNNSSAGLSSFQIEVISLCNAEREKVGLAELKSDNTNLQKAADLRAEEIKTSFSHTRPNGTAYHTVLVEFNVTNNMSGENIAYGQRTPAEVVNGWMNSSGHRANILNANFTHIAVGNTGTHWVQLFCR